MKLLDLKGEVDGTWDTDKLISLFCHQNCMSIVSSIPAPRDNLENDRLLFNLSKDENFSVKKAYHHIRRDPPINDNMKKLWKAIWKKGKVAPRVRLFIWRLAHNGLPLAKTIASRISNEEAYYATCVTNEDDPIHLILACPFARACWFAGPLQIRVDNISNLPDIHSVLLALLEISSEEQWTTYLPI